MRKSSKAGARSGKQREPVKESGPAQPARLMPRSGLRRTRRVMKTSELVARDIILDISEGGMKAGDALPPEASMLKHYEVGRASLREALRLLEVHGLVRIRAGAKGGPIVGMAAASNLARMLTLYFGLAGATYEDLTDVMLILYPKVAEVAASKKLSRAEIQQLHASIDQACGTPNPSLIRTETLSDFHTLLAAFSHNSVWTLLADAVGLIFADHIIATTDSRQFHAVAADDHKQIADAVLAQNATLAARHMLEHTKRMIEFYRGQTPAIFSQLIEWR